DVVAAQRAVTGSRAGDVQAEAVRRLDRAAVGRRAVDLDDLRRDLPGREARPVVLVVLVVLVCRGDLGQGEERDGSQRVHDRVCGFHVVLRSRVPGPIRAGGCPSWAAPGTASRKNSEITGKG